MLTVVPPSSAPKGTFRHPDIVATDAIEVAHAALDGYIDSLGKPDNGLLAIRDMLWAAMLHSGEPGGTSKSKQTFYEHVAHVACDTNMEWHCTLTSELLNAIKAHAEKGNRVAKKLLECFEEACRRNPTLKVVE